MAVNHQALDLARLPISPLAQTLRGASRSNLNGAVLAILNLDLAALQAIGSHAVNSRHDFLFGLR